MRTLGELPYEKKRRVYVSRRDRLISGNDSSPNGNQIKWFKDNTFIKLDCLGYESIAECMTSWLLTFTDLKPHEYIYYHTCVIVEDGKELGLGCYSNNFLQGTTEISFRHILRSMFLPTTISYDEMRFLLLDITGKDYKSYIDKVLCIDSIIRNDDRHFGNLSIGLRNDQYIELPIFDNGNGCLADTISYPMNVDFNTNYNSILAKPFKENFKDQLQFVRPILVDYDNYLSSVSVYSAEALRAFETIKRGLIDMKGISWEIL